MDAAIVGLVGLGGLYAIANQKDDKEGFTTNSLPNQNIPPKNYPIQSNNLKKNVNRYPNANQATDKYFNKSVYEKQVQKDTNAGSNLPTTQYKSLTGEAIDTSNFKHNNMVPYFGSKIRGRSGPGQESSILDNMQGAGSNHIKKQERAPLFKPQDNVQWSHGMPNHSDFFQQRQNPSISMNNVKPFTTQNVGPGLNQGYGTEGTGGFNSGMESRDKWLPKTVDQLRVETNPKLTFGLEGHQGPAQSVIKNLGVQGKMEKNQPDTYFINGPDRYFTTTGVEKAQTAQSLQTMGFVNRPTTTVQYEGVADGPVGAMAPQNWNALAKREHVYSNQMGGPSVTTNSATDGDYGIQGHTVRANNRVTTRQANELGGVQGVIGAVVAPLLDILRPSRKENVVGNPRSEGNVQQLVSGEYVVNPGDRPKTTIKEMMVGKGNKSFLQGQGGGAYTVSEQQAIYNQRDSTNTCEINGGGAPYGVRQEDLYFQNQRNNANKIQCEYTPQGCTSQWNNSMTMKIDTKRGTSDISRDVVPPNMPQSGPSMDTFGKVNAPQYYNECANCDRIQPEILSAFKNNPYTQSLHSHA